MSEQRSPSNIDPVLLALLGSVVVKWSDLELLVSSAFTHLSRGEPAAMVVVTANVSQNTITGWIRTLLDFLEDAPQWADDLRDVLADIDELRGERNALVHGNWRGGDDGSAVVHTARLERREVFRSELVTASDLQDTADRIVQVTLRLRSVLSACGAHGY